MFAINMQILATVSTSRAVPLKALVIVFIFCFCFGQHLASGIWLCRPQNVISSKWRMMKAPRVQSIGNGSVGCLAAQQLGHH